MNETKRGLELLFAFTAGFVLGCACIVLAFPPVLG